jgi:hypothetical protein
MSDDPEWLKNALVTAGEVVGDLLLGIPTRFLRNAIKAFGRLATPITEYFGTRIRDATAEAHEQSLGRRRIIRAVSSRIAQQIEVDPGTFRRQATNSREKSFARVSMSTRLSLWRRRS